MGISVADPIGQAGSRVADMLFKPFRIGKWFVLGFAAFLAHLGEGSGSNFQLPNGGGGGGGVRVPAPGPIPVPGPESDGTIPPPPPPTVPDEVKQFLLTYGIIIAIAAIILIALWVLVLWLRARGKFIFLDGVVRNHASIVEPWGRLANEANSFFRFDLLLVAIFFVALLAIGALSYVIALPDLNARVMGPAGVTAIVVGGCLALLLLIAYAITSAVAEDFLIPLMYLRAQPIGVAWAEFRARILPGNLGVITLFYLLRLVLGFGMAVIMLVGTCLTCCIALIPYIGTVIFLPLFVFTRAYSLYFLAQFGSEYNFMPEVTRPGFEVVMDPSWTPPIPPPPMSPPMPPPPLPPRDGGV